MKNYLKSLFIFFGEFDFYLLYKAILYETRPMPANGRQGLDWIVGPGYSFVVFSTVGQSDHFS